MPESAEAIDVTGIDKRMKEIVRAWQANAMNELSVHWTIYIGTRSLSCLQLLREKWYARL